MSKKNVPERITLTEKDLDGLVSRLEANELSDDDVSILKDVLLFSDWMGVVEKIDYCRPVAQNMHFL